MIRLRCALFGHRWVTSAWLMRGFCIACGKEKR